MKIKLDTNICFIDFETTGIDVYRDFPIQLGALLVDEKLNSIKKFSSFIKLPTSKSISSDSKVIHKLTHEKLKDAPTAKSVIKQFYNTVGYDYCLAGWNISFDIPFLRILSSKYDMMHIYNKINYRHIDVQTICQLASRLSLINDNVKSLDDCIIYFGLNRSQAHDALQDSELTLEVFRRLLLLFKNASVTR